MLKIYGVKVGFKIILSNVGGFIYFLLEEFLPGG